MQFCAVIFLGLVLPAIYFAACCVLAFWLTFGNYHFLLRVAGFSAAAYSLASLAGWFLMTPTMVGPIIVGMILVATSMATLRWLDYRWIGFSSNIGREELDRSTGRSIEEWFDRFDSLGGRSWSHAQLRAHVRERGFNDDLQKVITQGYEIYIGRTQATVTDTGERLFVDPARRPLLAQLFSSLGEQRSSIRDWVYVSLLVAALSMLVRSVPGDWTNPNVLMIIFAVAAVLSMLNIVVATNCLGLAKQSRKVWLFFSLFTVCVFIVLNFIGLARTYQIVVLLLVIQIFITGFSTAFALNIMRQKGYRIVPVCREPSNAFVPASPPVPPEISRNLVS